MNVRHASPFLLLAVLLPAQTTAAPAAPAPHLLIETVGPDGWRMRLGPTNLGGLLASEQGQGMWQPLVAPLLGGWERLVGDAAAFPVQRERVLGYGGAVRIGLWFGSGENRTDNLASAMIVLEPDGRTDMAALAGDVRQLQDMARAKSSKAEIDGVAVEVLRAGSDTMTAAAVVDGAVIVAIEHGEDVARPFAAARALARAATGKPPAPTTPAFRIDADIAAIVSNAMGGMRERDRDEIAFLGLGSVMQAQLAITTAGPHVQVELAARFDTEPRGLFAAFCPPTSGVSALQRAVPAGNGSWRVGRFAFQALFDAFLQLTRQRALPDAENARAEMKEELGIDLGDDLIAHMTDEVLAFGSPLETIDRPEDFTWAIAVALRDEKAFGQGLDTLLAKAKPNLTRAETTTIHGVECHRYGNFLNYALWFAVGRGTFFVAGGADAQQRLTDLLAGLQRPADAARPAEEALADLRKFLPPGLNAAARGDIGSLFAVPLEWVGMALGEILPFGRGAPEDDPELRERLRALLAEHQLATLRSATGYAESTWRWRLYW
jgi:hypothetical protein